MKTEKKKQNKRIREGDTIVVISGNDRGKKGQVLSRVENNRVIVQGVNVRKKAVRRSEANPQGGFIQIERPIHGSNIMLCNEDENGFRPKIRTNSDGEREIYGMVKGTDVVHRLVKKAKQ